MHAQTWVCINRIRMDACMGMGVMHRIDVCTGMGVMHGIDVCTGMGIMHRIEVCTGMGVMHRIEVCTGMGVMHMRLCAGLRKRPACIGVQQLKFMGRHGCIKSQHETAARQTHTHTSV